MRNGQNKRMRGRNRKSQNPLSRVYESNGPDVKIRGTASHVAEKYVQLARDAQASGDPVAAENYYQHAEHYFRMIAAAQDQFRQTQPYFQPGSEMRGDDSYDDADDDGMPANGNEPGYGPRDAQPYLPRDAQPYPPREPQPYMPREMPREQQPGFGRPEQPAAGAEAGADVERLPSFITGGGQPPQQAYPQNGHDGGSTPDRFPLHRRRRRHRGTRGEGPASPGADTRPGNE
jgi:hypothetical protein